MKKFLLLLLAVCTLLSGCSLFQGPANPADSSLPDGSGGLSASSSVPVSGAEDNALPDSLLESYYLSSEDPAFSYLHPTFF